MDKINKEVVEPTAADEFIAIDNDLLTHFSGDPAFTREEITVLYAEATRKLRSFEASLGLSYRVSMDEITNTKLERLGIDPKTLEIRPRKPQQ